MKERNDASVIVAIAVKYILWQGPDRVIFSGVDEEGQMHRVVTDGRHFDPVVGEVWLVFGEYQEDPEHGRQLYGESRRFRRAAPSGILVTHWLQQFEGIGQERAERIVQHFKGDLERAFGGSTPVEELAELIIPSRPNLSARLAARILNKWKYLKVEFATVKWLEEQGISEPRLGVRIAEMLGDGAEEALVKNPYILAAVLPWSKVDKVGQKILSRQTRIHSVVTSTERIVGAIDTVVQEEFVGNGHTAFHKADLARPVRALLNLSPEEAPDDWIAAIGVNYNAIVDGGDLWRAPGCAFMEEELHERFQAMLSGLQGTRVTIPSENVLRSLLDRAEVEGRLLLHLEQREAVVKLVDMPLACLVGGAGTGKTAVAKVIVNLWERLGGRVELAALSGKAALRLSIGAGRTNAEVDRPALTIARFLHGLELRAKGRMHWHHGEAGEEPPPALELPLLDAATLLVLDEASMIGLSDMHRIIEQMPYGCRLLMIGDPMQLPPISFGIVFHHLACQDAITARLTTIHRQTGASGIPEVSAAIRESRTPNFTPYTGKGSGVSFIEVDEISMVRAVEDVVQDLGGFSPKHHDLQIIVAVKDDRNASVQVLNTNFHNRNRRRQANDDLSAENYVKGWLKQWFAVGDPVMYSVNDYERDLRNGSLGHVVDLDFSKQTLVVSFDERKFVFPRSESFPLRLAYAITCHKAQGSSARRVVIPVVDAINVDVSWIYTAITRAEEQAVLLGTAKTLEKVLKGEAAWRRRITGCQFLGLGSTKGTPSAALV